MPVIFTYICEFLPHRSRGQFLVFVAAFWMLGNILCSGLAWVTIGAEVGAIT